MTDTEFFRIRDVDPPGDKLVPLTAALSACEMSVNEGQTLLRLTAHPSMKIWRTMGPSPAHRVKVATLDDVLAFLERVLPRFTPAQRVKIVNLARNPLIIGDHQ